ncbi:hypothetical protein [Streptomyces sp. BpilaLS-43]|uniref:hypothetical protein n=1 Tax=Streptomyces sp. BpilaLS-43 TaxID=1839778 RepID=UPI00114CA3DB|nr:hypothetical protein [Streptomyces sp. BpilaLS-43]
MASASSFRMALHRTFVTTFSSSRVRAGTFGAYCWIVSIGDAANVTHDIPVVFRQRVSRSVFRQRVSRPVFR